MENTLNILRENWYIWVLIILFGAVLPGTIKIFKPRIKGFIGEKTVALLLATLNRKKIQDH